MQTMGERLGVDYQQLQQFVSSSPWKVEPVRQVLVRRALQLIGPDAWVVDDTGFKAWNREDSAIGRRLRSARGVQAIDDD